MADRPLDEWSVEVPATAQHEGEYWLTVDGDATVASESEPVRWEAGEDSWWYDFGDCIVQASWLRPLADPTKPVRIRLKMSAERIEE